MDRTRGYVMSSMKLSREWTTNGSLTWMAVVDGFVVTVSIIPAMQQIGVTMIAEVAEQTIASMTDPSEVLDIILAKLNEVTSNE